MAVFGGTPDVNLAREEFVRRQPQAPAVAPGVEMGPRPGEIHKIRRPFVLPNKRPLALPETAVGAT